MENNGNDWKSPSIICKVNRSKCTQWALKLLYTTNDIHGNCTQNDVLIIIANEKPRIDWSVGSGVGKMMCTMYKLTPLYSCAQKNRKRKQKNKSHVMKSWLAPFVIQTISITHFFRQLRMLLHHVHSTTLEVFFCIFLAWAGVDYMTYSIRLHFKCG